MNCSNAVEMILGEKKWLEFKVLPCGTVPQYFEILCANYTMIKLWEDGRGSAPITGDCLVDNTEKTIKCLLRPQEKGSYEMVFTWTIADEIFKEKVRLCVC
ncbi:MAG: hypothetical protein RSD91_07240 [Clostridiales bacterium]